MSISRLDAWVEAVVRCLVEMEEQKGPRREEYADTYVRMLDAEKLI